LSAHATGGNHHIETVWKRSEAGVMLVVGVCAQSDQLLDKSQGAPINCIFERMISDRQLKRLAAVGKIRRIIQRLPQYIKVPPDRRRALSCVGETPRDDIRSHRRPRSGLSAGGTGIRTVGPQNGWGSVPCAAGRLALTRLRFRDRPACGSESRRWRTSRDTAVNSSRSDKESRAVPRLGGRCGDRAAARDALVRRKPRAMLDVFHK